MQSKNKRVLPNRAASWNVLSGNVSSPTIMKIPLVTNTVRMPLVTRGVPFSMNRGIMSGLKHDGKKGAKQEMLGKVSEKDEAGIPQNAQTLLIKDSHCPWCKGSNIARELKGDKRSLWRCLGCNRRWWASADNPRKIVRNRPKLSRQVYQGTFWRKVGGLGW